MLRIALAFAFAATALAGPLCIPGGSLASYEALGASGCVVDPTTSVAVGSFSYTVLPSTGVITPDTDIFVTPVFLGSGHIGLNFTSASFGVTGSQFVDYQIGFTWDPPPIRSADDLLEDPVVPPGSAQVTTSLCLGAAFTGTVCPLSTALLTVSDDGISPMLTDAVSFASVTTLGVLDTLLLNGGGSSESPGVSTDNAVLGGSADITGFSNDVTLVPEPATWVIAACGLLALAWRPRSGRRSRLRSEREPPEGGLPPAPSARMRRRFACHPFGRRPAPSRQELPGPGDLSSSSAGQASWRPRRR